MNVRSCDESFEKLGALDIENVCTSYDIFYPRDLSASGWSSHVSSGDDLT